MRGWRTRRRAAAAALAVLSLAAAAFARAPRTRAAQARDPILFVHGWQGDAAQWRTMMARFRRDGWSNAELFAWTFDDRASNADIAARISARIDQVLAATGASRVDVVTHSMGSLSTRYYLKNLARPGRVDAWASLGGPNHGTQAAWLCFSTPCREMRPGSPFLAALNRGDETPGAARYATWWSSCDEVVEPSSAALDGAENHQAPCVGHLALLRDTAVYRQVRDFVSGRAVLVNGAPRAETQIEMLSAGSIDCGFGAGNAECSSAPQHRSRSKPRGRGRRVARRRLSAGVARGRRCAGPRPAASARAAPPGTIAGLDGDITTAT